MKSLSLTKILMKEINQKIEEEITLNNSICTNENSTKEKTDFNSFPKKPFLTNSNHKITEKLNNLEMTKKKHVDCQINLFNTPDSEFKISKILKIKKEEKKQKDKKNPEKNYLSETKKLEKLKFEEINNKTFRKQKLLSLLSPSSFLQPFSKTSIKNFSCNCRKSTCLRLYCPCFKNSEGCAISCTCSSCLNNPKFAKARDFVIKKTKQINPLAFKNKYKKIKDSDFLDNNKQSFLDRNNKIFINKNSKNSPEIKNEILINKNEKNSPKTKNVNDKKFPNYNLVNSRGCRCKKIKCDQNYCECFKMGIGCSNICRCETCVNGKVFFEKEFVRKIYQRGSRKKDKLVINTENLGVVKNDGTGIFEMRGRLKSISFLPHQKL